eukprot:4131173-Heterocapsa_arctica.AAC.1
MERCVCKVGYRDVVALRKEGVVVPMINADQGQEVALLVVYHLHWRVIEVLLDVLEEMVERIPVKHLTGGDHPGLIL